MRLQGHKNGAGGRSGRTSTKRIGSHRRLRRLDWFCWTVLAQARRRVGDCEKLTMCAGIAGTRRKAEHHQRDGEEPAEPGQEQGWPKPREMEIGHLYMVSECYEGAKRQRARCDSLYVLMLIDVMVEKKKKLGAGKLFTYPKSRAARSTNNM